MRRPVPVDGPDGWTGPPEPRPVPRAPPRVPPRVRPRRRNLPWLRMMLLSAVAVTVLVAFAEQPPDEPRPEDVSGSIPQTPVIQPAPLWEPVPRPVPLYAVEGIERGQARLEVRRHAGGGREDTLDFGELGEAGSARLRLTRNVPEPEGQSFYIDLVRQGAEAGLAVVRSAQGMPLATKFGLAESANVTFAGVAEQACLALRFHHPEMQFSLRAWLCGPGLSEAQLTCLVDRLVVTGGEDQALRTLFAQAERQRQPACLPAAPKTATPKSPSRR